VSETGWLTTDDGVQLWYRSLGSGTDTLVVPGAAADVDLDALATDRRVIFYDARNRGRSDRLTAASQLGFYREVDDLDAARAHFGLERFAVFGWSYNAAVVAYYAMARPVRVSQMVLVSPIAPRSELDVDPAPAPAPHLLAELDQLKADGLDTRDPEAYCRAWRRVYVPVLMGDPAAFDRLRAEPCACRNEWPDHVARALAHVFIDLGIYDWRDELRRLDIPTLVVHGEADQIPLRSAEEWRDALPAAQLLPLAGVGHFPWVEASDAFFGAVRTFLARS
jgi:pimeloyl-ACP methyl ester carboxylesterase